MPVGRLLNGASFEPSVVKIIASAFDASLSELGLDRTDPNAEIVAQKIIECAHAGERDPERLRNSAVARYRM